MRNHKDHQRSKEFPRFAIFYTNIITNFVDIANPSQMFTPKDKPFKWSQEEENSFQSLNELILTTPFINMWQGNRFTVLETDASEWTTGSCLS